MSLRLRNPLKMLRSNAIALDIGSGHTRILTPQRDVLLNEPTVIAVELGSGEVIVTGAEAKTYLGKAPDRIRVLRPMEAGSIVDFEAAKQLLQRFLSRVLPDDGSRIRACVTVPQGLTELEKRTISDCCKAAGISQADFVSSPLAAAVGAGLDITAPKGRLLLGIGAGLAEATMVSLTDVVHSESIKCGGNSFHEAVTRHLLATRQVSIGENMAEQATLQLARVAPGDRPGRLTLTGKQAATGSPIALELCQTDLDGALDATVDELEALVRSVMEHAPTELVADLGETGLLLYGGGAQLCGLDQCLAKRLDLRVVLAEDASLAAVRGAAAALRPDLGFRKLLVRK